MKLMTEQDIETDEIDNCFVCAESLIERFARVHSKDGNAEVCLCINCFERWRKFGLVDYVTLTSAVDKILVERKVS
jgi:hypothetical protein